VSQIYNKSQILFRFIFVEQPNSLLLSTLRSVTCYRPLHSLPCLWKEAQSCVFVKIYEIHAGRREFYSASDIYLPFPVTVQLKVRRFSVAQTPRS